MCAVLGSSALLAVCCTVAGRTLSQTERTRIPARESVPGAINSPPGLTAEHPQAVRTLSPRGASLSGAAADSGKMHPRRWTNSRLDATSARDPECWLTALGEVAMARDLGSWIPELMESFAFVCDALDGESAVPEGQGHR